MKNIFFPLLWNNNFFMNVMSRFLNDSGALLSRSKRQNIRKNSYRCLFLYLVYIQSICIEEYFVTFFLNNDFFVNTLLPLKIVFLSENNLNNYFFMNTSLPLYDCHFVHNNLDNHFLLQILERRERLPRYQGLSSFRSGATWLQGFT